MIVAPFALDRLDDNRCHIDGVLGENFANAHFGIALLDNDMFRPLGFGQGEVEGRRGDARPVEFRKVICLARIGVGQTERITTSPMEGALEVKYPRASLAMPGG